MKGKVGNYQTVQGPIGQFGFYSRTCFLADSPASLVAQLVKESTCSAGDTDSWVRKMLWRRDRLPNPVVLALPRGSDGEESACNASDLGSVPELGRSPGGERGNPLQYSCLDNPHRQRSLEGHNPWDCKESDTAK